MSTKAGQAQFSIGGGQNPARYTIHYAGGTEKDYERDPYAAPFRLRRVRRQITLPAVGDAFATITYDAGGKPVFVHTAGADTMGAKGYMLHPLAQLRVYFHQGKVVRVILAGARDANDEPDHTVDLASEANARRRAKAAAAGVAVLARAAAIASGLATLAE